MLSRSRHLNNATSIQILERRSLSPKSSLYLVKVESKKILIADSPTGVSLVCDSLPEEESVLIEEEHLNKQNFSDVISNKIKGFFVKNA
jgi:flagellar biogenesis protein FliO